MNSDINPRMWYASGLDDNRCGIRMSTDTSTYQHRDAGYGRPSWRHSPEEVRQHFITPRQHRHLSCNLRTKCVVYFEQLWGSALTSKLVEIPFFKLFSTKINQKRSIHGTPSLSRPVFACWPDLKSRQKWKNTVFFVHFQTFFLIPVVKGLKLTRNIENGSKKVFLPAFGCAQHPKAGQNTQHTWYMFGITAPAPPKPSSSPFPTELWVFSNCGEGPGAFSNRGCLLFQVGLAHGAYRDGSTWEM